MWKQNKFCAIKNRKYPREKMHARKNASYLPFWRIESNCSFVRTHRFCCEWIESAVFSNYNATFVEHTEMCSCWAVGRLCICIRLCIIMTVFFEKWMAFLWLVKFQAIYLSLFTNQTAFFFIELISTLNKWKLLCEDSLAKERKKEKKKEQHR